MIDEMFMAQNSWSETILTESKFANEKNEFSKFYSMSERSNNLHLKTKLAKV